MPLDPNKTELWWFDIETTGLHPDWHELIQLGISISDWEGNLFPSRRMEMSFSMKHPERVVPFVRDMHFKSGLFLSVKLEEEDEPRPYVTNGRPLHDNMTTLECWADIVLMRDPETKILLAGHNISNFDLRFLEHKGIDLQDLHPERFDHHVLDIWPLIVTLLGPEHGHLHSAAKHLGLEVQDHTALKDAELACAVYQKLRPMIVELQASQQEGDS